MHPTLCSLMTALGLTLSLAACNGGGPLPILPDPLPSGDIGTTDPDKTLRSHRGAAGSLPRFGSVTQSTNRDANGVTTDRASAAFDGADLTVTVTRADSSTITLDTDDAVTEPDAIRDTTSNIPGEVRTLRNWDTLNVTDRAATAAGLVVTSVDGDTSDWLAGGAWLHIAGQNLLSTAPTVTSIDAGAFVDAPELRSPPENLPGTGTARYEGYAGGSFAVQYGTGLTGVTPGSTEFGRFDAIATLTANFADNTISGCIGCESNGGLITGVFTDGATGAERTFTNTPSDTQLRLGAAAINSDGTFRASDVTLLNADARQAGLEVTEQDGSWGGRFSNIPVATGEPRLAAGTFGGAASYTGGSEINYVGAFGAGKQ